MARFAALLICVILFPAASTAHGDEGRIGFVPATSAAHCGEERIGLRIRQLKSADPQTRKKAIADLTSVLYWHLEYPTAVDSWTSFEYRAHGVSTGGGYRALLRQDSEGLWRQLIGLFNHEDDDLATTAMIIVAIQGERASIALDPLLRIMDDDERSMSVRMTASTASYHVAPRSRPVVSETLRLLKETIGPHAWSLDEPLPNSTSTTISAYGPWLAMPIYCANRVEVELPQLLVELEPTRPQLTRAFATIIIAELGRMAKSAIPTLRTVVQTNEHPISHFAGGAIVCIEERRVVARAVGLRLGQPSLFER